jgi:hypothetical protein
MEAHMQMAVYCFLKPYFQVDISEILAATIKALMLKAASTSEMSEYFYQTTRRNNSEDSHLHK